MAAAANFTDDFAALMREKVRRELRSKETLRAFMRRTTPAFDTPEHLAPYIAALEQAQREPIDICISAPPQHGKTELTMHALLQIVQKFPHLRHAYVTYAQKRADSVSGKILLPAARAGLDLGGSRFCRTTPEGGQIIFAGLDGQLTGEPIDGVLIVDDPCKGRADAESATMRDKTWEAFKASCISRCHPSASKVVMATRWHPEDTIGRLVNELQWKYINLPAISADGKALWPERRPLHWLEKQRETFGEYDWSSLYMGQPHYRGSHVYNEPIYYDVGELPTKGFKVSIGADFAYTGNTHSDFNAYVVIFHTDECDYIVEARRYRNTVAAFKPILTNVLKRYGGKITAFIAATEQGVIDFLLSNTNGTEGSLRAEGVRALTDKFVRASPNAARWNAGKIRVPKSLAACTVDQKELATLNGKGGLPPDWMEEFMGEIRSFTGVGDKRDDLIDSLSGAFHPFEILRPTIRMGTDPLPF